MKRSFFLLLPTLLILLGCSSTGPGDEAGGSSGEVSSSSSPLSRYSSSYEPAIPAEWSEDSSHTYHNPVRHEVKEIDHFTRAWISFFTETSPFYGAKVIVRYSLNGKDQKTEKLPRPENGWGAVLDHPEYHNLQAGDRITYQFQFTVGEVLYGTELFEYRYLGDHRTIPGSGIEGPVFPYDPKQPIVLTEKESRRYAFVIFVDGLSVEQLNLLSSLGVNTFATWSTRDGDVSAYQFSYKGDLNTLAKRLNSNFPSFYNVAPAPLKTEVSYSEWPTETPKGLKRFYVTCFSDVTESACRKTVEKYSEGKLSSDHSEYEILATEKKIEQLSYEEDIETIFEMTQGFPDVIED